LPTQFLERAAVMKIAVVEIGHWHAGGYIGGLRELGEEIVAVSDRDPEKARRRADELGCAAYCDAIELIDRERPDFVFAHGIHCEMTGIAAALVERDVPFVMEKPMGVDWRELSRVADEAERKGLFVGVDLVVRLYRATRELVRLRDAGELGRMTSYTNRLLGGEPQRYHAWNVPWVLDPRQAGGGPLFNFAPHIIDLLLYLSGQEARSVFCRSSRVLHGLEVEDYASVSIELSDGAVGTIQVGYVCPDSGYDHFFSVCTDKLFYSATSYESGTIQFRDGRELDIARDDALPKLNYVAETLRRFRAGESPVASIRDMCRILRVINAAVESAETGAAVSLA